MRFELGFGYQFFDGFSVEVFDCLTVVSTDIICGPSFPVKCVNSFRNTSLCRGHRFRVSITVMSSVLGGGGVNTS